MVKTPRGRRWGTGASRGFGSKTGISVPISFGLPLIVVGLFLLVTRLPQTGSSSWSSEG